MDYLGIDISMAQAGWDNRSGSRTVLSKREFQWGCSIPNTTWGLVAGCGLVPTLEEYTHTHTQPYTDSSASWYLGNGVGFIFESADHGGTDERRRETPLMTLVTE